MRRTRTFVLLAAFLGCVTAAPVTAGPIFFGPSAYTSYGDSPFAGGAFSFFHLENFEDGLNTPGAAASGGLVIGNDPFVDSVEGGSDGHSWYSGPNNTSLEFLFDATVLGTFPTHVGIVWTDIGFNAPTPYFDVIRFEAFDAVGTSLGVIGPFQFGDGSDLGETAEDRFLGAVDDGGISKIRVSTNNSDWEVDHLQYGASVPEPATLTLLGVAAAAALHARRRQRRAHRG